MKTNNIYSLIYLDFSLHNSNILYACVLLSSNLYGWTGLLFSLQHKNMHSFFAHFCAFCDMAMSWHSRANASALLTPLHLLSMCAFLKLSSFCKCVLKNFRLCSLHLMPAFCCVMALVNVVTSPFYVSFLEHLELLLRTLSTLSIK